MILIVAFANGVQPGDVGLLVPGRALNEAAGAAFFIVDPEAAHGIMHGRENFHRHDPRIDALELLVDLQNAAEFAIERLAGHVREVEVNAQSVLLDRQPLGGADVENLAGGNVARHEVAVLRIPLLEEIAPLDFRNVAGITGVVRRLGHPDAATLAAGALAHQPQFVGSGNRRRVDLDELSVAIPCTRPVGPADGAARADHRHRRAAVEQPAAARGNDDSIRRKGAELHGDKILADRAPAPARIVEHRFQEVPELPLLDLSLHFPAADLLVKRIEQLLAGGRPGEGRSLEERTAKPPLIAKTLGSAVERHAQTVHQVDDPRAPIGHFLDRRLVLQEVAAVDRIVEMLPLVVALLPRQGVDAVDAPLGADAVRAFDRYEADEIDACAEFRQPHGGG